MLQGTIKKKTDRGFGFIGTDGGRDLFFHMSSLSTTSFEVLREGQLVSYEVKAGPRGDRAENVIPL